MPLSQAVAREPVNVCTIPAPAAVSSLLSHQQCQGSTRMAEKAKNYTSRVSATAKGEVVTAVGLRNAVLRLIQYSLVTQVRL